MPSATRYALFVSVTPGLEALLGEELTEILPGTRLRSMGGGVELRVTDEELWKVAVCTRLGESLRVRVGRFEATDFRALKVGLGRIPWAAYLRRGVRPPVRVTCHKSRLYHSDAVAERVVASVTGGASEIDEDPDAPMVHVRLFRDRVVVSVDASGTLLHRRGYRIDVGVAPIRETLAAACVRAADLSALQPVWDPFCGSGTLVIEAVAMSRALPAQDAHVTTRAFQLWPSHDEQAYGAWTPPEGEGIGRSAWASDIDPAAVDRCGRNAERAGVGEQCNLLTGDFQEVAPKIPEGSAVIGNLPYGKRAKLKDPQSTLRRLGDLLRTRDDLGPVLFLDGVGGVPRFTGLPWTAAARFSNRGKPVTLWRLKR